MIIFIDYLFYHSVIYLIFLIKKSIYSYFIIIIPFIFLFN